MKKLITLLLLFTLVGFLSANQVIITNDYQYIITTEATYNFTDGNASSNVKYDRTNKIAIQNNKVLADPLKYHYAFFWDEADSFIGYYKTNKGITTSGSYLGQVNTQSIPLPLNAYSFALVRYDNDYVLVNGFTIKDLFIDSDNYFDNDIEWNALNNNKLQDIFNRNILTNITALSNGVKYYEISSGNIVQRVQEYVLQASDIVAYIPLADTDIIAIDKPLDYITYNSVSQQNNNYYIQGFILNNVTSVGTLSDIGKVNNDWSFNEFIATVATGTYANLAAAKTALAGTTMLYQLTTPITILTSVSINQTQLDNFYDLYDNVKTNTFLYSGYSTDFLNPTFAFDTKLLNLTEIFGAGNEPNQATIEAYYDDYLEYLDYSFILPLAFNTQTISFETIYFDDGVSTEIEQLGSILIFTLIGFTLMIFGFASKRRIFNLLAVGAFVVLGFLLIEFVGFIIILFGLIFVNVYYTFFGEL